jgi:hypothetical protein
MTIHFLFFASLPPIMSSVVSAYNIRQNSVILLMPTGTDLPPNNHPKSNIADRNTEQSTISQIRSELYQVRNTLTPSVDVFLHTILSPHPQPQLHLEQQPAAFTTMDSIEKEHTRLAELLLQSLLRLDAITTDGEWEEARAERKGAVKEVQGLLDRLDGGWTTRPAWI